MVPRHRGGLAELVAANPDARTRRARWRTSLLPFVLHVDARATAAARPAPPRRAVPGLRRVGGAFCRARGRLLALNMTDLSVPFEQTHAGAICAGGAQAARFPFRGGQGVCFEGGGRSGGSSSRRLRAVPIRCGARAGVQELVAAPAVRERASRTSQATNAANIERLEISLPTVYVPVRAEVRYENVTYVAPPSETRVACFAPPFDDGAVVDHDGSRSSARVDERPETTNSETMISFFANLAADSAAAANASFAFRCALRGSRSSTREPRNVLRVPRRGRVRGGLGRPRRFGSATSPTPATPREPIREVGDAWETKSALSVFETGSRSPRRVARDDRGVRAPATVPVMHTAGRLEERPSRTTAPSATRFHTPAFFEDVGLFYRRRRRRRAAACPASSASSAAAITSALRLLRPHGPRACQARRPATSLEHAARRAVRFRVPAGVESGSRSSSGVRADSVRV